MTDNNDDDDDLLERVSSMADHLKLKGNDRRKYIHDHMTRSGYRMEPTYVRDDDGDDDDDDTDEPFFGRRRANRNDGEDRRSSRRRSGQSGRRGSQADNWYS